MINLYHFDRTLSYILGRSSTEEYGPSGSKHDAAALAAECALPGEPEFLVGREDEMTQVLDSISDRFHMCCITGPPAVGKSALAVEAVRRARSGRFSEEKAWNIVYVDVRHFSTLAEIVDALLRKFKLNYSNSVNQSRPADGGKTELIRAVRAFYNLCIVIDNADLALNAESRHDFVALLKEIMNAGRQEFTLLVTSCYRLDKYIKGDRKVKSVVLEPLKVEPACEILKAACRPDCQPSVSDMEIIAREFCQGFPDVLWQVGKDFDSVGMSSLERVATLFEDPSLCLGKLCEEFGTRHLKATLMSLPKCELDNLNILALFEGQFSVDVGAVVFGMGKDTRKFQCKVIDSLYDHSLVLMTDPGRRFRLPNILREYLRSQFSPLDESFLSGPRERYCYIWLKRLMKLSKNRYAKNPVKALRQVHAMIKDVKQALKMIKLCSQSSNLYVEYLAVAYTHSCQSLLQVCLTATERVKFYTACIPSDPKYGKFRMKLRLRLAEAHLDSDDVEEAKRICSSLEAEEAISRDRSLRLQHSVIQARISVEKGDSPEAVPSLLEILLAEGVKDDDQEFGNLHRVISDAYCDLGEYEKAFHHLSKALDWCRRMGFGEECKNIHPDVCVLLFRLGYCLFFQRKYNESRKCFSDAFDMLPVLRCDHLSAAAALYLLSICRLAANPDGLNCLEARKDLKQVILLLEGEPSFRTIPLWILAKQLLGKLLTIDGYSERGRAPLDEADKHLAELEESVEDVSSELTEENNRFRRIVNDIRQGSDVTPLGCLNLHCSPGLRALAFRRSADYGEAIIQSLISDFEDTCDSVSGTKSHQADELSARTAAGETSATPPLSASKHHQRFLSGSSPETSPTRATPPVHPPVHPVPLRTFSSKTDFGLMCCSSYPPRKLSGSLASFQSFDAELTSGTFESDSYVSSSEDGGIVWNVPPTMPSSGEF